MADSSIPVVINPTAGRGRAGRNGKVLRSLLEANEIDHFIIESDCRGDVEARVLSQIEDGADRIIVAGGDGSIHEAVNGLMRSENNASIGLIPMGTGNDFAKACDIPLDWEDAARLLVERLRNGVPGKGIDVGRMNDRYFANSAGIGFDAKVTQIAESIRLEIGDFVYLLAVFRAMWDGVATSELHIDYDGGSYSGRITLASFANGDWVGGMFHIAPTASNDDGVFDLVIAKPVSRLRILGLLPRLMRGTHIEQPEILHAPIKRCHITADAPVPSHLDGEVQALSSEFSVRIIEKGLHLL